MAIAMVTARFTSEHIVPSLHLPAIRPITLSPGIAFVK
jgi:hypothetical protein